jgi:DNA segregation ATPase FtsK/SpoIIIE-like protein
VKKNRRVKKNSPFPYTLLLRRTSLIAVICLILISLALLINTVPTGIDVEGADIFAVFSLFVIAIATVLLICIGIEKLTGRSWLNGLELIGERTLWLGDLIYSKTLDFIQVDTKKSNRRIKKRVNVSNTKLDIINEGRQSMSNSLHNRHEAKEIMPSKLSTENEPTLDFKVVDIKPAEEPSLGSELFQNSFPTPIEKISTSKNSVNNDVIDESVSEEMVEISHVDDLLDELLNEEFKQAVNLPQDSYDSSFVNMSEPLANSDTELEEESEYKINYAEEKNSDEAFVSAAFIPENLSPTELIDENNPLDEEPRSNWENELEKSVTENLQINSSIEDELPAPSSNNLFADLSKNNLMGLSKQHEDKSTLNEASFQLSTPSTMLEQAKQVTANILSGLQPVFNNEPKENTYTLPAVSLLDVHEQSIYSYTVEELDDMSRTVERVLLDYKVSVEVQGAYPGPVITRFELSLAPGVKVSRVSGLAKDLARAMRVTSVRVVEIIAGTSFVGLEIPNQEREMVSFREIIASDEFQESKSPLSLSLGKDVSGKTVVSDLGKMPHVLVAGTTGSGKSVAINTMILSMLFKATPEQVRMIMIDPKMLELSTYEGIPHLLTPVVTDMKEAQSALRWAVAEMERRYKLMSKVGVRGLEGYNQKIDDAAELGEPIRDPLFQLTKPLEDGETFPTLEKLPHIVIVIDELADMMMIVGKKVEELIARLAQKARAAGIHLILATQRPSVDVLTGLIKANVPTRISFQVSSRIDSRTILDQGGAEALLGNGDMLFLPSGTSIPIRAHGAFVADDEVHRVVEYLKTQGTVRYLTDVIQEDVAAEASNSASAQVDETDVLYNDALDFVYDTNKASISSLQRRFKIGYNRAARMIDQMEEENIVSQPEGNGSRSVIRRD